MGFLEGFLEEQFSCVFGVIIFLLNGIFGGEENVLGECATRPKTKSAIVFDGLLISDRAAC